MKWLWAVLVAVLMAGAAAMVWPASEDLVNPPKPEAPRPQGPAFAESRSPSARIERKPDGTIELDGRFMVTGSGTEQDPFVISWPLVFSASETIDAAAGKLAAPVHIDFLNGQWVQLSGYLAPPLWGEQTSELLVMKNRWDGCCIGLPPTPFDCIEASLAAPLKLGAQHTISFGTVRGRLMVEPFKAGVFLLGLYRLEDASIAEMKSP
ncbi:MAG: hypothetical protein FJ292_08940 [Planctomycetes bacterium]|nr:hypothetical protein [Planctomycetota bacterium]